MEEFSFEIQKRLSGKLGRAGLFKTPHGVIETPVFTAVGTKATVKALTPQQLKVIGTQVVLSNTYHLYLQPGDELIKKAGGLSKFMSWDGPTMTDSGGFQVFSLGAGFGGGSKFSSQQERQGKEKDLKPALVKIDRDGVTFRSHRDGSEHRFTPEKSIEIQKNIGADIIFVFDECTSPHASYEYQKEAMERTHRWAKQSLDVHKKRTEGSAGTAQALFGIVQGGRFEDLRKESAKFMTVLNSSAGGFDGFGIGGSFSKEDLDKSLIWINKILPEEKLRHLLGIGEPVDLFVGIENGIDMFDCVAPTRIARTGMLYTTKGPINILNAAYRDDLSVIDEQCNCSVCSHYTRAYVAHLFRAGEMLAATLASIHNLYFIVSLVKDIRQSILNGNFELYRKEFLRNYYG